MKTDNRKLLYVYKNSEDKLVFESLLAESEFECVTVSWASLRLSQELSDQKPYAIFLRVSYGTEADGIAIAREIYDIPIAPIIFILTEEDFTTIDRLVDVNPGGFLIEPLEINRIKFTVELARDKFTTFNRLQISERKLKKFFDNNPLMLFVLDNAGTVLDVNETSIDQLGYKREELLGKSVQKVFSAQDSKLVEEQIKNLSEGKDNVSSWEIRKIKKDGESIWVKEFARKMKWDDGRQIILISCEDITDKKTTEKKFLDIIEHSTNLFYSHTTNHEITYISPQSRTILDCEPEEALVKWTEFVTDNPVNKIGFNKTQKAIDTGIAQEPYELELKTAKGRVIWVEVHEAPVIKSGKTVAIVGSLTDITESKKAQLALKASEEKYRQLIDQSHDVIYLLYKGKFEVINKKFTELTGYNFEEVNTPDFNFMNLVAPKSKKLIQDRVERSKKGEDLPPVYEFAALTKTGEIIDVEASVTYIKYKDGVATQGILRDIRERKKMESALKESEERFRTLFENSTVGMYRSTPDGDIDLVNPRLLEMLGYPSMSELKKRKTIDGYIDKEDKKYFDEILKSEGIVYGYESVWLRADGTEINIRESARAINDENGNIKYYEGIVEDITEQIKARQALIEAKEKAEKSDKMKTDFLAQVSHEIRTPINAILSFADLLKLELDDRIDDDLKGSFNIIDSAGKRITRTVDLILNMAELQSGIYETSPKDFDLYQSVLRSVYLEYRSQAADKGLDFKITNIDGTTIVYADEYSVTQIFRNLVDNAIKFTDKGSVEILINNYNDQSLEVQVNDTGIGISDEYLPLIFEPFSQEEQGYTRKYEGNGLGLALVNKYCQLNRIKIDIETGKDKGTKFKLLLPLSDTG